MAEIEGPSQRIGQPVMETVRPLIIHIYRSAPDRTLLPRYLIERLIMVSSMRAINLLNLAMSFDEKKKKRIKEEIFMQDKKDIPYVIFSE